MAETAVDHSIQNSSGPVLEVKDLKKHFPVRGGIRLRTVGWVLAVDGVSFSIGRGETLGLVGESGCGKTTVGKTILKLIEPTSGKISLRSKDITHLTKTEMRDVRREMQMIFQDPYSSLNPRMSVGDIVAEPLENYGLAKGKEKEERVAALLSRVGLEHEHIRKHPHEFSGGQRQRIGIARALALNPSLVVADEPVSSLDVSIRAQVLNLMKELQTKLNLTIVYVSHDLRTVYHLCNRVAVMYLGKISELATIDELYKNPQHPYTQALISSIPVSDPTAKVKRIILKGSPTTPVDPPPGCRFHPRCASPGPKCAFETPQLVETRPGHFVACHSLSE